MERNKPLLIVSNLAVIIGISILVLSGLIFTVFNTPTGFFDGTISGFATADSTINNAAVNLNGFEQRDAVVGQEVEWINPDTNEIVTTIAPEVSETAESEVDGKIQKKVTVASDFHYQNVLTYASVPDLIPEQVRLYWMIDGVKTEVTEDVDFDVTFYDENNDNLIDKISWITPHLSEQEFILEFDITVINPWEFGQSGGEWVVYFDTTGTGTLNITKDDLSNSVLTFNYLKCGTENISYNLIGQSYVVENYTCSETATISHTIGDMPSEIFSMRFDFGNDLQNDVDFAYDPAVCEMWPMGVPGEPDCETACGAGPPSFIGFDMDPGVDGACYSDPMCETPCGGGGNTAPSWDQAINNSGAAEDSGTSIPDTDLTASGNGQCTDADGDTLSFIITTENTSQVDCKITSNQLSIKPAANWYGNGSSCVITCDDGTDNAATTVSFNITGVNDAATAPDLTLNPSSLSVGNTLTATVTNSTDSESDTIAYYSEFYNTNDTTTIKAFSTTHTYTVQSSDEGDLIRVRAKAEDSATNSTVTELNITVVPSACMSASGNVFDISSDTSCSSESISDVNSELRLGAGNLKLDKGEFKYLILNMTDDSNAILNISGSNFTTFGIAEIKNRLIVNGSTFNISNGIAKFHPGSRAVFINSTLITNNSIIHGSFDIDPSNWTNYGNLTVNNTVNVTDTTLNVTDDIIVLTAGWLNITNSTVYSKGTNVTGNVTIDPSTWEEHGDLIVGPGGLMDFIDTGVIVHGKVIVDGGTLNFLLDSVLQMNIDNLPSTDSDVAIQDIGPDAGLMYVDASSRMERNSTTNYNVNAKAGGEFKMYGNATDIEDLTVSSDSTLTFDAAPSIEVEGTTSLEGTLTMASSHFVSNGTGTLSITGANFYNLTVETGTTTLGTAVTIDNVFLVTGTLTTSNNAVTAPNIDLDGTINAGSSVITINGNANMTGGTYTSGTSKLVLGGTSVFNPGDNSFDRLNVSSGNNARQFGNATINQLFCPLGVYNVSGAAELILNRSKQVCSTKAYWNISLHNGKIINASINGTNITHINGSNVVIHPISSFILDSGNFRNVSAYTNITESSGTSVVDINLSYNDDDVNDVSESTIKISRYTGSAWSQVTGSTLNTATNIISATLSTFSLFGGGGHEKSVSISLSTNLSSNLGWKVSNTTGMEWTGHNNNGTGPTGYYINISANQTTVNLTIKADAALTSGGNTIALTYFNYSYNNSDSTVPGINQSITTSAVAIGNELVNKSVTWLKFFLTVPTQQAAGNYTNTVTIAAAAA